MYRSPASAAGIPILLLIHILYPKHVDAQASVNQAVSVSIAPILSISLRVGSEPGPSHDANPRPHLVLHYNLTTNVRGAVLTASLRSLRNDGASGVVEARSDCGTTTGPVPIRADGAWAPVVTDIQPGLENGQEILLTLDDGPRSALLLALTLRDPGSGASQTVMTPL